MVKLRYRLADVAQHDVVIAVDVVRRQADFLTVYKDAVGGKRCFQRFHRLRRGSTQRKPQRKAAEDEPGILQSVHRSASILNVYVEIFLAASPYHRRWAEVEQNRSGKTEKKSSFHCGDAPALVPLIADAGVKREHILAGVRKTAAVCLADLADIRHMVGAGTQLGRQGDLIADVQRVDLPEVAVGTAVMGGEADIALPDGGVLEMPDALDERLAVRSLIDPHAQTQRGDLNLAEGTVFVVEVARYLCEQHSGLIAAAAIHRTPRVTTSPLPLITAPAVGRVRGARFGVRYSPVCSAFMLSEPKAGGMRAAFLLTSVFFIAPPSAVWMTSMEVSLPKS